MLSMKLYFWQQRKPNTETGSSEWISMILNLGEKRDLNYDKP